jgi:hypothetical protein
MELLLSNILPVRFAKRDTGSCFENLLESADSVRIATGYVSVDSMVELKRVVEENKKPYLELMIGMHGFEGFTHLQYETAMSLDEYLRSNDAGGVKVSTAFKFHGKIYTFSKKNHPFASILGSSNLNSIFDSQNLYEADLFIEESNLVNQLDSFILNFSEKACMPLSEHEPIFVEEKNEQLEGYEGVKSVKDEEFLNVLSQRTNIAFKIPVKASNDAQRSNLNVFFGKGRKNARGDLKPRHWYEVELIVPKEITTQSGYPCKETIITVYTDDLWKFKCKISGDCSKNFRSADDLEILGRWIKGRLENKGSLKRGEPVTEKTLEHYGRDDFDLISTVDPLVWMLDFKP